MTEWWQFVGTIVIFVIVGISFWYSEDGEEF